jgi:hypothetical protein
MVRPAAIASFQHDDGFSTGILELMFELARGVERIDVDDRITGAEHRGCRDRILQDVWHHQRDARTLFKALALEIGGERERHLVEVAVGDGPVHADEGFAIPELCKAFFEQFDQG